MNLHLQTKGLKGGGRFLDRAAQIGGLISSDSRIIELGNDFHMECL